MLGRSEQRMLPLTGRRWRRVPTNVPDLYSSRCEPEELEVADCWVETDEVCRVLGASEQGAALLRMSPRGLRELAAVLR